MALLQTLTITHLLIHALTRTQPSMRGTLGTVLEMGISSACVTPHQIKKKKKISSDPNVLSSIGQSGAPASHGCHWAAQRALFLREELSLSLHNGCTLCGDGTQRSGVQRLSVPPGSAAAVRAPPQPPRSSGSLSVPPLSEH